MGKLTMLGSRVQEAPARLKTLQPAKAKRKTGKGLQLRRQRVYRNDPRCATCRRPVLMDEFHLDHKVALVNGGRDTDANCQVLCIPCHEAKTRKDLARAAGKG